MLILDRVAKNRPIVILWRSILKWNLKERRGYQALLASALAFSLMTVCIKKLEGRLPVAEIVLSRSIISILITRLMLKTKGISPWGINKGLLFIRGLLGTSALFCIIEALNSLPLASATVLQYTYPTFTALAAWLFLGEGTGYQIWTAVLLGWIGITMVANPLWISREVSQLPLNAVCIALTGALLTALAYVCVRKLSKSEHQLVIIYYFPLISIPVSLPLIWSSKVIPLGVDWLWLIGIGLLTQFGQIYLTKGLTILPAAKATSFNYSQVLFASILGFAIFSETLSKSAIIGSFFIFGATLVSISAKQKEKDGNSNKK